MPELLMTNAMRAEHTILIVDDEVHIRRLVEVNLNRVGYKTRMAQNGQECLDEVAKEQPDLILLDWMMPVMNGMDTMKQLQANPATMDIPVVFLTAKGQDQDVFIGWSSGASSYITKPFNPREVLAFVDRIMLGKRNPEMDENGDGEPVWDI